MYISLKRINENHNMPIELIPIKDENGNRINPKIKFGDIEIILTTKDNVDIVCSIPYQSLSKVSWYASIIANYNNVDSYTMVKAARKIAEDIKDFYKELGIDLEITSIKFEEF